MAQTRRRLMILSDYTNSNLPLTDDDLVELAERGEETEYISIEEMIERFGTMPTVRTYGINRVEIRIRETNELERIVRTRWDDSRDEMRRLERIRIEREIERLQSSLT